MLVLPISDSTLIYGSPDSGATMTAKLPDVINLSKEAAQRFHLAGHIVSNQTIFTAGDMEIHRTEIGDFALDLSQCFPAEEVGSMLKIKSEPVKEDSHRRVLYRMLRPEFLYWLKITGKVNCFLRMSLPSGEL
jgi:hypothetical protein